MSSEAVTASLETGRIYDVGGVVRDRLLQRTVSSQDRDYLVTGVDYDDLTRILRKHGRVDLVGRSFGVIKFTERSDAGLVTFDITLPRREHSTGWGHKEFEVAFDPDISVEDDLVRRDFTVNAMAVALDNGELVDPLGGQVDLENRLLRMVYPGSFEDDPLRMLRAVQFAARFDFSIEPKTLEAMSAHAKLIATVSAERVSEEMTKLLTLAEKPSDGFRLMQESGLLKEVLPELENCVGVDQPGGFHKYDVFEHSVRTVDACRPDLLLRLAALFHDSCKPQAKRLVENGATFYGHETAGARAAQEALQRLKYSHDLAAQVSTLIERHMFTTDVTGNGLRRLVKRVGVDFIFDLLALRRADVRAQGMGGTTEDVDSFEADIRSELSRKPPFSVSDLAIDGHEVMDLFHLEPGPMVGEVLDYLLEQVLDNPGHNVREKLESLARAYLKQQDNGTGDSNVRGNEQ